MRPGRRHSRDKIATLLWPNAGEEHARQSLRQALATLRRALRPHAILLADHRDARIEGPGLDVDVVRFETLAGDRAADALEQAVLLYQGELLAGIRVKEPPFDEWLLSERERLRVLALHALARLLAHHENAGRTEPAIMTAMRILALDAANETVHRELMRLFDRQGRRAEALRQYRLCLDALQRDLGVEPQLETRQLYQSIVRAERGPTPTATARRTAIPHPTPAPSLIGDPARQSAPLIGRDAEVARLGQPSMPSAVARDGWSSCSARPASARPACSRPSRPRPGGAHSAVTWVARTLASRCSPSPRGSRRCAGTRVRTRNSSPASAPCGWRSSAACSRTSRPALPRAHEMPWRPSGCSRRSLASSPASRPSRPG